MFEPRIEALKAAIPVLEVEADQRLADNTDEGRGQVAKLNSAIEFLRSAISQLENKQASEQDEGVTFNWV